MAELNDHEVDTQASIATGTVSTNSRIRYWWLVTFRGYRFVGAKALPLQGAFGLIGYRRTWWLRRKGK